MGKVSFENFGIRAENLDDHTLVAGRCLSQRESEKRILPDILRKLDIQPGDDCLDIGCGTGNLLIPLSFLAGTVTGIDHPQCIEKLRQRFADRGNIRLLAGNFLESTIPERFSKVVAYSVLHYLKNRQEVFDFMVKAVELAAPGGKILLGDIPNESRKVRFLQTQQGQAFDAEWRRQEKIMVQGKSVAIELAHDADLVRFDDELILAMIRSAREQGCHAYVLPQPTDLPFGHSREDILIENPY